MARLTLGLLIAALLLLVVPALWMRIELFAPGLRVTAETDGGLLPRFAFLRELHGWAAVATLPLIGAFAGFAAARRSGVAGRLAGWNGLAITVALIAFLVTEGGLPPSFDPAELDFLNPDEAAAVSPLVIQSSIILAASLWALFVGTGALVGAEPGLLWGGRLVQLLAGVGTALFVMVRTSNDITLSATAPLVLPAFALFAVASLDLARRDSGAGPYLWAGSLVMLVALIGDFYLPRGIYSGTTYEIARLHFVIYGITPFALLAAWSAHLGRQHGGGLAWGHAAGLFALTIAASQPLYRLGQMRVAQASGHVPDAFAPLSREATLLYLLLTAWAAAGFILCARRPGVPSAARGS